MEIGSMHNFVGFRVSFSGCKDFSRFVVLGYWSQASAVDKTGSCESAKETKMLALTSKHIYSPLSR